MHVWQVKRGGLTFYCVKDCKKQFFIPRFCTLHLYQPLQCLRLAAKTLISAQLPALIRRTSAFRSTSGDALLPLADVLPLDLEAKLRVVKYCARKKSNAFSSGQLFSTTLTEWKDKVKKCKLNPAFRSLLRNDRILSHIRCNLNYWSSQLLTGYGLIGS